MYGVNVGIRSRRLGVKESQVQTLSCQPDSGNRSSGPVSEEMWNGP
jgi:hypothetical protein